jgi:hypothetical protein
MAGRTPGVPKSERCGAQSDRNPEFCLLTSFSKNEGASGDVHENKGAGKIPVPKPGEKCLEGRSPQSAMSMRVIILNSVS